MWYTGMNLVRLICLKSLCLIVKTAQQKLIYQTFAFPSHCESPSWPPWRSKPQSTHFFFSSRWHIHHNCWICPEASYSYGILVCICILNLDISPVYLSHVIWLFVHTEETKKSRKINFHSLYPHKVCINQLIQLPLFVFQNLFTSLITLENVFFFFGGGSLWWNRHSYRGVKLCSKFIVNK